MRSKEIRLYNVIFPIWMLWFIPATWILILPANFVIDLAVLFFTLKYLKVEERGQIAKKCILRVWICGFLADIIGSIFMFLPILLDVDADFVNSIAMNPFESIWAMIYTTIALMIAGGCIYLLNLKFCLNKSGLELAQKKKVALVMAVITAPYLYYLPTAWFY